MKTIEKKSNLNNKQNIVAMDNKEIVKKNKLEYTKLKDIIIAVLLIIWMIIPMLKELKFTSTIIVIYEYRIMEIIGLIGIYLFIYDIYRKIKNTQDKKQIIKEIAPILILVLYLIWTLIACFFAQDKYKAFYGTRERNEGYITYLIYGGFFLSAFLIDSNKIKKVLLNVFLIVAILNIIFINLVNNNMLLVKVFNYRNIQTGVFGNLNHYGYYLLLATVIACILFVIEKNRFIKVTYLIAYLILLYTLIYNNTFGCYIALCTTLLLFLIYSIKVKNNMKSSIAVLLIFIILSVIVQKDGKIIAMNNMSSIFKDIQTLCNIEESDSNINNDNTNNNTNNDKIDNVSSNKNSKVSNENTNVSDWEKAGSGRAKLWKYGIKMIVQKPLLGYGAENLRQEYAKYGIDQDRPHNLLIQLATTSGIPGLLLYMSAIILILFRGFKRLKNKECNNIFLAVYFAVIAYLISAMFGNSMYYTSPYFFILLGMVMNFEKTVDNKQKTLYNICA